MTAVLAVVLASSLFLTYGALTRSAEGAARDRLTRAVRQVAVSVSEGTRQRASLLAAAAATPEMRAALGPASDTNLARPVLASLAPARDGEVLPIELWNGAGALVFSVHPELNAPWQAPLTREQLARRATTASAGKVPQMLGVTFAPMYGRGEKVYFWAVAPVRNGNRLLGFVAQERHVTGPASATQSLRNLTGEPITMYLHNGDGSTWVRAPGFLAPAPARRDSAAGAITRQRSGVGLLIAAEAPIDSTPWSVALEIPVREVRGRARGTLMTLAGISLLLVVVGAAISWVISRRVTRPLVTLTNAAEAISRGEFAPRAEIGAREDEIGRLAHSFDQMASEIASSHWELERRISEADLARQEAERANRAKSDFLAVMSHELRTPLNAIAGYAQLLELEVYGALNPAQRDALLRIGRSQAHLLTLINNVLNFAKIDAGQTQYALADLYLDEVLAGLEPLIAPQIRAKGLVFDYRPCDPALQVRADSEKLQQVVLNLLTNAIKFTPPGGGVAIDTEEGDDEVQVHVRDTGAGIPADRLRSVFEPFVQADRSLSHPNEGVGLGLAIARDLARGMGGSLRVESVVGEGSVFTLTLPRAPAVSEPLRETADYSARN